MSPSFGLVELIALLVSLGDFGVSANPKAPPPADIVKYAPADADLMLHVDLQALVPHNYKAIKALPGHELVRNNPQSRRAIEDVINEIDMTASMIKGLTGIDPVADLGSLTVWLGVPGAGDPKMLVVVRGNLASDIVERAARTTGAQVQAVEGHPTLTTRDGSAMLVLKGKELLIGTPSWVAPRIAAAWKAPGARPGSGAARLADALKARPFFVLASMPSAEASARLHQELADRDNVAAHMFTGHELAIVSLLPTGVWWTVTAREASGYDRVVMASEGIIEVLRAGSHATRGVARLALAALHSYAGTSPEIDAVLRYQAQVMRFVEAVSGDGSFQADLKKDPKQRTVTVRATGKKFSDVVPALGIVPAVGFLYFRTSAGGSSAADEPIAPAAPAALPRQVPGLDVQRMYRDVKRAQGM